MKKYSCSEYPDEGFLEAKNIDEAKEVWNCMECDNNDCCPIEVEVISVNGSPFLKRKDKQ